MPSSTIHRHDLKIKRILNHEKSATGVFLEVLFDEGQKAWLSLNFVIQMTPRLVTDYLKKYPDLSQHHELYYRYQ